MAKRRRKTSKKTIKKAHRIARGIMRGGGKVRNPWAVGMAQAKGTAKRRKRRSR